MKQRILSIGVVLWSLFMIIMAQLSNMGVFWDRTIEQLSYSPNEILVPAGYTFAIWGIIYLGVVAFAIYQLRKDTLKEKSIQKVRPWLLANVIANWLRLPAATMTGRTPVTVVLIVFILISLWFITYHLRGYATKKTKWITITPMSLYYGWITAATFLNIGSYVSSLGYTWAVESVTWVLVRIGLAYITSLIIFTKIKYLSYILVTIWALAGVAVARQNDERTIMWTAIGLIIVTLIYLLIRKLQKKIITA